MHQSLLPRSTAWDLTTQNRLGYCSKGIQKVSSFKKLYRKLTNNHLICSFLLHKGLPTGLTLPSNLTTFYAALGPCYRRLLTASWASCALTHFCLYSRCFRAESAPLLCQAKFFSCFQVLMTIHKPLSSSLRIELFSPRGKGFAGLLFIQLGVMFRMYYSCFFVFLKICLLD